MERTYENDELLTSGEVAALFKVERKTVNRWEREGRIPQAIRTPGGHRRYSRAAVMELLRSPR